MKRLIAVTAVIVLSLFLVVAAFAAAAKEPGSTKPAPKGDPSVKSYYEKDKQRNENKKKAQKMRQQQIENDANSNKPPVTEQ